MRYRVVVTFEVETDEYEACGPTPEDVVELVTSMLAREADLPDDVVIDVYETEQLESK